MRCLNLLKSALGLILLASFWGCASQQLTSARIYIRDQNWEKAEEMLLLAKEVEPDNPEIYFHLGKEIYGRRGQWSKMNEMFEQALAIDPARKIRVGGISITVQQGVDQVRDKYWGENYNKGANLFNEATQGDPASREKNLRAAIEAFKIAREIKPEEAKTYRNLLFCYVQMGQPDLVDAALAEALARNPGDVDLMITASQIRQERNDLDSAIVILEQAARISPGDVRIIKILANSYFFAGDYEEAIFSYRKALREEPDDADLHYNLGLLYLQPGIDDYEFAEMEFQKVVRTNPDDKEAVLLIAEAYRKMEKWDDAEGYYRRVLELDPNDTAAMRNMAVVIFQQGRPEEGQMWLDRAKALE